jgi:acyl-CoA synthetase (AMP-forming)/AMP-acid ligase II
MRRFATYCIRVRRNGIVKIGAVLNPINIMLTPERVRHVIKDSRG